MLQIRSAAMGWVKEPGAEHQTPVFLRNKTAQVVSKLVQVGCTCFHSGGHRFGTISQWVRLPVAGHVFFLFGVSKHKPWQCAKPILPPLCIARAPLCPLMSRPAVSLPKRWPALFDELLAVHTVRPVIALQAPHWCSVSG